MALVDCTVIVQPNSVVVSSRAASTVTVSKTTTQVQVAGAPGIRGPKGESGLDAETSMDLSLIYRLST